ncbi:MAG: hypothetical protein WBM54_11695 [Woeseia sp.]
MFKVFSFGIFLGLVLAGVAAYFVPVADLHRETSLTTVRPNGGITELFTIRIPEDRVMAGTSAATAKVPGNLKWPQELSDAGIELELFKLRNRDGVVVGVASRLAGGAALQDSAGSNSIEWVLNLPARGSLYFPMAVEPDNSGNRVGRLRGGSREFRGHTGTMQERFAESGAGGEIALELNVVGRSTDAEGAAQ